MNQTFILSCLVFLFYVVLLPTNPEAMFTDPDTYWHISSGNLIRSMHAVPTFDPWSLSAGTVRWYNISWLWDVLVSYTYEQKGWYGVIIINAITVAATLALIFANCLIRSRSGISAFITIMLVPFAIMNCSLRPFEFSELFIALTMLILRPVSLHTASARWLVIIPLTMLAWANIHGGFLVAFFLLGVYGLEALANKDGPLFAALLATGLASLLACLITPYGLHIVTGIMLTMQSSAASIISEWQPFSFSGSHAPQILYLLLFLTLVMLKPLALAKSEKWIMYSWLVLGLHTIRHMAIFAVVSAPALALGLSKSLFKPPLKQPVRALWVDRLAHAGTNLLVDTRASGALFLACLCVSAVMFQPYFKQLYRLESFNPLPDLSQEINYLDKSRPHARLLNSYNLGGPLTFLTHGRIPVFIDGRVETAYPHSVISDYMDFHDARPGWAELFERYHLDGAIIPNSDDAFIDRFSGRKGWHVAFRGSTATIFLHDKP